MATDYLTIDSAPRDGTAIEVTDFESGFFPMRWNASGTNALVSKSLGIWEATDGSFTWCEDDGFGPTHWCPLGQGRVHLPFANLATAPRAGDGRGGGGDVTKRAIPAGICPEPDEPVEIHHVEAAIRLAAWVVVTHGDVYAPILDRLEAELVEMQRRRKPADPARAILRAYTIDGGVKAIR